MDYGFNNSHNHYAAQPSILHRQHHPPQAAANHLYPSSYYSANNNPYPNMMAKQDDPSQSAFIYADNAFNQPVENYAGEGAQALQYGAFQAYQTTESYSYAQNLAANAVQQARKFNIKSGYLDLETKKQRILEGGASADAVRICTACNVVCNSATVFATHLAGEKHIIKVYGKNALTNTPKVLTPQQIQKRAAKILNPNRSIAFTSGFTPKIVQSFPCEVCKLDCNSVESYNAHKMGRKHRAKLQKLQEKITPKLISVASSDDKDNNSTKTPSVKEDLETKKAKIIEGGTSQEAIMVCTLCEVVCNSKAVYDSHVAGKRHLIIAKKESATP